MVRAGTFNPSLERKARGEERRGIGALEKILLQITAIAITATVGHGIITYLDKRARGEYAVSQPAAIVQPLAIEAPAEAADAEAIQEGGIEKEVYDASSCSVASSYSDSIRQWCGTIEKYAAEYNLDPNLIAAVMTIENPGGIPDIDSKCGAIGLMQVMPEDGYNYPNECPVQVDWSQFVGRPTVEQLSDPDTNIKWGAKILSWNINAYGSVRDGLLHYGPMYVEYTYADDVLAVYNSNQ